MPSDEKIERVARAIYETRGAHEPPRAWRKWEDIGDEARAVWCQCATAALSAAHAEPVAWEHFCDESYFDMWCVRPTGERAFGVGFHVSSEAEAIALVETLAGKASPRPEAVGEDWRAVDDAIWFYLGHENHKPEDGARLRRMSGVVLGLAGEENKG
jgi:hypothetical protein